MVFVKLDNEMNASVRGIAPGLTLKERQRRKRATGVPSRLVKVNVSGREFHINESDLKLYPETLLGSVELEEFYQPALRCYFFDRSRIVFEYIASFYQTGALSLPNELDSKLVHEELTFFRLMEDESATGSSEATIPESVKGRMHLFLNYPASSREAGVWAGVDMLMILAGILFYCLETEPSLKIHFTDHGDPYYPYIWWAQTCVTLFFSIDLALRAASWPKIRTFFKDPINVIDFLSLVPFYMQYLLEALHIGGDSHLLLSLGKLFRMIRVVRVVKFFKYFKEMFLILDFIVQAWKEIVLIICLTSMLLIIFGSILYNCEKEHNEKFYSIAQGFWWSLTTITTVGYGDISPVTWLGQLTGSILVIFSLVVLTLPMTIIITKFNYTYETKKKIYQQSDPNFPDEEDSNQEGDEGDEDEEEAALDNSFWFGGKRYSIVSCPT